MRDTAPHGFVNNDEQRLLSAEEDERNLSCHDNQEGELHEIRLNVQLVILIFHSNVLKDACLDTGAVLEDGHCGEDVVHYLNSHESNDNVPDG